MLYEQYLNTIDNKDESIAISYQEITNFKDGCKVYSKELEEVFSGFYKFFQDTKEGKLGKTVQFWTSYINFIHLYHHFTRSIRMGDLEVFISCPPKLTNIFFALNHPSYARWLVKHYDSVLKLNETHPEVYREFKQGWFAIRRTEKLFSSTAIDLTLEQTVNAEAARQHLGLLSITNSISARQCWAESHYLRTSIVSTLLEHLGMTKKDDISQHIKPNRIKKTNASVRQVLHVLREMVNPLEMAEESPLFNIVTGKSVMSETENFFLNIDLIGGRERNKVIDECRERPETFEERIKRQKLSTFTTEAGKKRITSKDGKILAACFVGDLFGSLLELTIKKRIDIREVLAYPLTPLPPFHYVMLMRVYCIPPRQHYYSISSQRL